LGLDLAFAVAFAIAFAVDVIVIVAERLCPWTKRFAELCMKP
jgi:hypothetical protein